MTDSKELLGAIFDLSMAIHDCRNNATFRTGEKTQLRIAFDQLTTRSTLIRLNRDAVDAAPDDTRTTARDQLDKARDLLGTAERKSERQEAIGETFDTLELLDALLPEQSRRFLM